MVLGFIRSWRTGNRSNDSHDPAKKRDEDQRLKQLLHSDPNAIGKQSHRGTAPHASALHNAADVKVPTGNVAHAARQFGGKAKCKSVPVLPKVNQVEDKEEEPAFLKMRRMLGNIGKSGGTSAEVDDEVEGPEDDPPHHAATAPARETAGQVAPRSNVGNEDTAPGTSGTISVKRNETAGTMQDDNDLTGLTTSDLECVEVLTKKEKKAKSKPNPSQHNEDVRAIQHDDENVPQDLYPSQKEKEIVVFASRLGVTEHVKKIPVLLTGILMQAKDLPLASNGRQKRLDTAQSLIEEFEAVTAMLTAWPRKDHHRAHISAMLSRL